MAIQHYSNKLLGFYFLAESACELGICILAFGFSLVSGSRVFALLPYVLLPLGTIGIRSYFRKTRSRAADEEDSGNPRVCVVVVVFMIDFENFLF